MNTNKLNESYVNKTTKTPTELASERVERDLVHGTSFITYLKDVIHLENIKRKCEHAFVHKQLRATNKDTRKIFCAGDLINVRLLQFDQSRIIQVSTSESMNDVCHKYGIDATEFWYTIRGKPVRANLALSEYGVHENCDIVAHERLKGGAPNILVAHHRLYTHVYECELQVLQETRPCYHLQGEVETAEQNVISSIMLSLSSVKDTLFEGHDTLFETLENFFQVVYWFRKCDSMQDYTVMVALAHKLMTGKCVSSRLMYVFGFKSELQGEFTDFVKQMRDLYTTTQGMIGKDSLLTKVRRIYTYLLVQGVLTPLGVTLTEEQFLAMEAKTRYDLSDHTSMVFSIFDVAITICERVDAYLITGDLKALIHNDLVYAKWAKEADRILALGPYTSNLAAHGTTYFAFVSDLTDAVETGEAICGYTKAHSGAEGYHMKRKLDSLKMLKNTEITRRASQKERKAPFGVLVHGGSSVAKSTFTKMLFYYYAQVHGLKADDHFRYVRNPTDEYWSNFDSSKWCIQLDDIAFLLPEKSNEVDPTLKEMLSVINNVPYVPPQAALEDKGKTPVLAELVVATTNAEDLNALAYFHCPLAVRRRLPFVVNVKPKPEYLSENKEFIDPSKLPAIADEFPDYWIIQLQKLKPVKIHGRYSAKLEVVQEFTSIKEFLKVFGKASKDHKSIQLKSQTCDVAMRDIKVCRECCASLKDCECNPQQQRQEDTLCALCYESKTECVCTQGSISGLPLAFVGVFIFDILWNIFQNVLAWCITSWLIMYLARFYGMRRGVLYLTRFLDAGVELKVAGIFNSQRNIKVKVTVRKLLAAGKFLASMYVSYKVTRSIVKRCCTTSPSKQEDDAEKTNDLAEQGNIFGSTEEQLAKETAQNVWYNPTLEMCRFDVPVASQSLANHTPEQIRDMFAHNCVRLSLCGVQSGTNVRTCGTFVRGQWLLLNKHIIDWTKSDRIEFTIVTMSQAQGLSANTTFFCNVKDVKFAAESDVAMVKVKNFPPVKDILRFWAEQPITATHIVGVRREFDGTVTKCEAYAGTYNDNFPVTSLNQNMSLYFAQSTEPTKVGDCGTLAVARTPMGPVIVGQHMLGHNSTAGFVSITKSTLEKLMGDELEVVAGEAPKMQLNGDIHLPPPHHRSLLRYLETGSVRIYGSLPGFRAKPKSKVCATPLRKEMCEHFETKVEWGPPVMNGWQPWKKNVAEMVKMHTDIDDEILTHCVESYSNDILAELDATHGDKWKGELVFLSDRAAVNGLPGVKYIDRINTNTSMGFPWATTKKRYLESDITEDYPEGVTFTADVWERVRAVERKYEAGERAYPIFTGHLKDEPTTFAKIEAQKTRVFTGAPVDWSLIVRSRLLTFVRLLQKNKFIFEAGPGTVCQSTEWTNIHTYLTSFGEDQIVAGDYGKFDKRMAAHFVLAAFDIIIKIHESAGFSPEECRQLRCIGMDTAFPVVNMNGDIMEFYGTNPSGHPLTVIVNSLVNSLYMRYAYCLANPKQRTCTDFKTNVHLFTYGDDNIMGVSKSIPWFNHCVIQEKMETIGVEYTMADKESESVPYINLENTSFLKRSWRWEEELQSYVCPLEEKSIHKSLTTWVPSKTIDKYDQMVAVISSANSEYFFFGKEVFNKHHAFFKRILQQHPYSAYVSESTLPDWDALCQRFREASKGL